MKENGITHSKHSAFVFFKILLDMDGYQKKIERKEEKKKKKMLKPESKHKDEFERHETKTKDPSLAQDSTNKEHPLRPIVQGSLEAEELELQRQIRKKETQTRRE
jgi:type IV secretory pathway VirB10-like protein